MRIPDEQNKNVQIHFVSSSVSVSTEEKKTSQLCWLFGARRRNAVKLNKLLSFFPVSLACCFEHRNISLHGTQQMPTLEMLKSVTK